MKDTIFGLATAAGRSAIAVVRLSGPGSHEALSAMTRRPLPAIRQASLRTLLAADGSALDEALVIRWSGPKSFTGEDVVELHLHGGAAVIEGVLDALASIGLRSAEPGEFTRRAFENNKLSLVEAEAVADLIDAESKAQRKQALEQLGGALDRRYAAWREALIRCLAQMEAAIDFPDEDLPPDLTGPIVARLEDLRAEWVLALAEDRGRQIRDGYRIAIVGPPNAGKSSLFNGLVGRDAAIVAPIEGTTRDVIEAPAILGGYRVILADMAGLRETPDPVEAEGVRRAKAWAEGADLRLYLQDLTRRDAADPTIEILKKGDWLIGTKADLARPSESPICRFEAGWIGRLNTNNPTELSVLRDRIGAHLAIVLQGRAFPATTRARHRSALALGVEALTRAIDGFCGGAELVGEDLRLAARALERVTGRIDSEQILDEVFSTFCIGK
jgi:tRNA modification GTPase